MKGKKITATILSFVICLSVLMISGCSSVKVPKTLSVSAVSVDKNGEVTAYIIDSFDKSYYQLDELSDLVTKEIADFNASHGADKDGEAASVLSVTQTDDLLKKAVVVLRFQNPASYRDYMGLNLFYGTVSQALTAGYELNSELVSVKNGNTLNSLSIREMSDSRILIVEDKVRVYSPAKPQFINKSAVMNEDGSVEPSETEENTFIIMK